MTDTAGGPGDRRPAHDDAPERGAPSRAWYRVDADEALRRLRTDRSGLGADEVRRRRAEHGPNRLREQAGVSAWRVALDQFTSPLIYVLVGALAVSLAIERYGDAIVVGAVLVVNGTIGFVQEHRAQTAVQSLMEMVSPVALVRRDGRDREIDASEIVPGDIVTLRRGEVVPADTRLLESEGLRIDEAALTGESVPVGKGTDPIPDPDLPPADQRDMAFMGTAVTAGEGLGVVVETGHRTRMGRIAEQIEEAGTAETPLEMRIDRLAKRITAGILAVAVVAFATGLAMGRDVDDMLLLAVALSVSAIPAGLPIVVTVALAIGVHRMARRHALIRKLPAVDTLGSCTAIVSDKTGTLTQNRMTVRAVVAGGERIDVPADADDTAPWRAGDREVDLDDRPALRDTLVAGMLCNDATLGATPGTDRDAEDEPDARAEPGGDPMEVALLDAGRRAGLDRDALQRRHPRRDTVPFRTERRYMATVHDLPGDEGDGPLVLVKGAPERVARMCDRTRAADGSAGPIDPDDVMATSDSLAEDGLRVLAMAVGHGEDAADQVRTDEPHGLTFVGMQALLDPPRPTAADAVDRCHDAGIRVLMVTGDHASTATAVGRAVHIGGHRDGVEPAREHRDDRAEVRTGQQLADLTDPELDAALRDVDVFARVAPGQKLRIVERLKAADEIVAVTGDGVNDAPALESAHIGAAMGSGTDVAKEASDMVVTDDDFASVYAAVEEGRTAFRNIRMATFFLLSTAAAVVTFILTTLVLDWPLPLLPAQILWMNVVTNGIADIALAFQPGERSLFRRPPRPTGEGVLDERLLERLVVIGLWLAAGTLAVFAWQWRIADQDLVTVRTATLTTMVLFQKVHVFNCRSEDASAFRTSLLANRLLFVGVLSSLTVHVAAMYVPWTQELLSLEPLPATTWLVALAIASTAIVANEAHKRLRPRADARAAARSAGPPEKVTAS